MNIKVILLFGLMMGLLSSCSSMLEPYPNGDRSGEDIWEYQDMVQGLIGQCYENMPRNYNDNEGAYLDGATDNAVITSSTYTLRRLATGTITTSQDPFLGYWSRDYQSIYLVNKFLKDRRGYNTRFLVNLHLDSLLRNRLQGEAFALRAWFQWDLLQKFGGKGTNGQMLGYPIILEPYETTGNIDLARNSYDECVKQIIDDCDSAYKYLPIAHRDFLVTNTADKVYAGGKYWGRFDGITTRAIKAMVYLTWASPRFNPGNDISRWDSAAVNAKKVIDFKLTVDNVKNGFNPVTQMNWFNPNFPGIVISSRYNASNDAMERMFYPGGFQGNGVIGATQELVDAFPMKNGYPINDPANRGNYDPANPYLNRDPRFYSTIFYNNVQAKKNNTGVLMYTFENWSNGGKDAAGVRSDNCLTNYYIKKFVYMGLNWSDASIGRLPHSKFFIRWTHMCLTFAEAANHVVGPNDASRYGISAKTAVQYMRARKTTDGANGISAAVPGAADAYLTEVANSGGAAFDELLKNERRIETCFEGMRFYDLRRWTTDLTELNKAVHGVSIEKNEDGTFTYDFNNEVEARSFTSAYLPIPYNEMLKVSKLIQNEGWDSWN
ncbi:MAG: RagB/SusD family nutrient uptake outer membrane protein [Bacteroidales bacterium]|nr:RagB/SusD family nutrient uptake outer membrane protein [Bacteroidales bacterium]